MKLPPSAFEALLKKWARRCSSIEEDMYRMPSYRGAMERERNAITLCRSELRELLAELAQEEPPNP